MKKNYLLLLSLLMLAGCMKDAEMPDPDTETSSSAVKVLFSAEGAVKGQLIVKFRTTAADSLAAALAASPTRSEFVSVDELLAAKGVDRIAPLFGSDPRFEERHRAFGLHQWYVVTFDDSMPLQQMVRSLSEDNRVEILEYAHRPQLRRHFPVRPYVATAGAATRSTSLPMNDPLLAEQWHYHNDGQTLGISVSGADINLYDAWEKSQGNEAVVVAVLDQAVQYTHPDLAANMWVNPNPASEDERYGKNFCNYLNGRKTLDWSYVEKEGDYESNADHGTHVAGTIAAINNNGLGVSGIAGGRNSMNGVKIMSCQIFGDPNQQTNPYAAADAFRYAADNGALICQCSWGYSYTYGTSSEVAAMRSYFENSAVKTAIDYFIATAGSDNPDSPIQGGLVIFAAGNDGDLFGPVPEYPASYDRVVSVAAMGSDLLPAYYTCYNEEVDVTAPGGDLSNSDDNTDNGGVLSTILCDPNVTRYVDRRDANLTTGCYGYLQGTSMACPHVSGVAALGLSYLSQLGFRMSAEEFKNVLLESVRPIDPYLTGTKTIPLLNNLVLKLSDYQGKMGAGYVDADLLLENLRTAFGQQVPPEVTKQIPNQLIKKGTPTVSFPLKEYFTDDAVKNYTASANDERVVKVEVNDGILKVLAKNVGQARITVSAEGFEGTVVSQRFVVTVRSRTNTSDGWL